MATLGNIVAAIYHLFLKTLAEITTDRSFKPS